MSDYRVEVRIRNARILNAMASKGFRSQAELARAAGLTNTEVSKLVSLRKAPVLRDGDWSQPAMALSSALSVDPELLWTHRQRVPLETNRHHADFDEATLDQIGVGEAAANVLAHRHAARIAMAGLTPREIQVVRERIMGSADLKEIGDDWGVSMERVRQIEAKAVRKMRGALHRAGVERLGDVEALA